MLGCVENTLQVLVRQFYLHGFRAQVLPVLCRGREHPVVGEAISRDDSSAGKREPGNTA